MGVEAFAAGRASVSPESGSRSVVRSWRAADELASAGQCYSSSGPPAFPLRRPCVGTAVVDTRRRGKPTSPGSSTEASATELDSVVAVLAGGGPIQLERLRSRGGDPGRARHPRIHLDTASYGARALGHCVEALGTSQLVYGSDRPVVDPASTLAALAGLGPDVLGTVRIENPGRLFA